MKTWEDLFNKIESKLLPTLAYFADKYEDGIIDVSIDTEHVAKYSLTYNVHDYLYEVMGLKGFLRIVTDDINDGNFTFCLIKESGQRDDAIKGLDDICQEFMITDIVSLMELTNLLLQVLNYYLKKEKELVELNATLDSLDMIYQNTLLIEKIKRK